MSARHEPTPLWFVVSVVLLGMLAATAWRTDNDPRTTTAPHDTSMFTRHRRAPLTGRRTLTDSQQTNYLRAQQP